jgi:hypothetical protein
VSRCVSSVYFEGHRAKPLTGLNQHAVTAPVGPGHGAPLDDQIIRVSGPSIYPRTSIDRYSLAKL